jgi:hypothetical protein
MLPANIPENFYSHGEILGAAEINPVRLRPRIAGLQLG